MRYLQIWNVNVRYNFWKASLLMRSYYLINKIIIHYIFLLSQADNLTNKKMTSRLPSMEMERAS